MQQSVFEFVGFANSIEIGARNTPFLRAMVDGETSSSRFPGTGSTHEMEFLLTSLIATVRNNTKIPAAARITAIPTTGSCRV
tara:strand:- start:65 stop:310 length:246 start_codon:yes stop_codon:yes gene_type:complete